VKVVVVRVAESIASLKVAVTFESRATSTAELAGSVELTVGAVMSPTGGGAHPAIKATSNNVVMPANKNLFMSVFSS
jgi:hypothetical protein